MNFEELYNKVRDYMEEDRLDQVRPLLLHENPVNISQLIRVLPLVFQGPVFRLLPKDLALSVFEELNVEEKQTLLSSFKEERAMEMISHLDPDDQVELIEELPAKVATRLLARLSSVDRHIIGKLLGYPPDTAGRIMTPEFVALREEMTVNEALEKIRRVSPEKETIYYCYVTDDTRLLKGVVSLKDLVLATPETKIKTIMYANPVACDTHADQEYVAKQIQEYDLLAIPVVDKEKRLVGIVTVDDAMDILQEEATEDIFAKAGIGDIIQSKDMARSYDLVKGTVPVALRARIPYLIITLVGGMLAGGLIGSFAEALESIVVLAFFIPVVMDMGGNVGTQSSTIFTRGLLLGHINMDQFFSQLWRETRVGSSMGLLLGLGGGIFGWLWQGIDIGMVVFFSLFLTITLATVVGYVVPFVLTKMGLDQAAGADPIITTVKDISGLLIYFTIATFFLGHLM